MAGTRHYTSVMTGILVRGQNLLIDKLIIGPITLTFRLQTTIAIATSPSFLAIKFEHQQLLIIYAITRFKHEKNVKHNRQLKAQFI